MDFKVHFIETCLSLSLPLSLSPAARCGRYFYSLSFGVENAAASLDRAFVQYYGGAKLAVINWRMIVVIVVWSVVVCIFGGETTSCGQKLAIFPFVTCMDVDLERSLEEIARTGNEVLRMMVL